MVLGEYRRELVLRFSTRRKGYHGKPVEIVHFYSPVGGKVFHARCERGVILSFLERVNESVRKSKTGKTIYLEGSGAEGLFRKLIILAGCKQCTRATSKILEVMEAVAGLGEFETIFWYSNMIKEYERSGYWGVCRVARAFRILYRID